MAFEENIKETIKILLVSKPKTAAKKMQLKKFTASRNVFSQLLCGKSKNMFRFKFLLFLFFFIKCCLTCI